MAYCSATRQCRVYIGNSADYTQNTQCGADQIVDGENMFTCNLQGKYVTTVMYSSSGSTFVVSMNNKYDSQL